MFSKCIVLLLLVAATVICAPENELAKNLFPKGLYDDHKIYSGYLDTTDPNRKLHYVFLPSQNDPVNDPIVLWLNGGPGCSSLLGFIQEHGPVIIPDYQNFFERNEFSWNKLASMIYLESPAGVGFSYNDNGEKDFEKYDDIITANDNKAAMLHFFQKFPEYKENPFYISGESYAGVYVPMLANLLVGHLKNLKGILVGNGLTDYSVDVENALIDFAYDYSLYSPSTRDKIVKHCKPGAEKVTKACNEARTEVKASLQGINIYDIYRICPPRKSSDKLSYSGAMINTLKKVSANQKMQYLSYLDSNEELEDPVGIWPKGCLDDPYPTEFFNKLETKDSLNVRKDIIYQQCSMKINNNYKQTDASLHIYPQLFKAGVKVWFFAGDTDAAVPFTGAVKWIPKLKLQVEETYRPWFVRGQVAGFVQVYDKMTYLTVKGTGHMVPQWKREESFAMFKAFLNDYPL